MTTKTYPIDVALTVASGKMLCYDFGDVHEAITDLAGWPVMTHHMASEDLMGAVAATVLAQAPWMAGAIENMPDWSQYTERATVRAAIDAWLDGVRAAVGNTVTLELGEPVPYMSPFDRLERLGSAR